MTDDEIIKQLAICETVIRSGHTGLAPGYQEALRSLLLARSMNGFAQASLRSELNVARAEIERLTGRLQAHERAINAEGVVAAVCTLTPDGRVVWSKPPKDDANVGVVEEKHASTVAKKDQM